MIFTLTMVRLELKGVKICLSSDNQHGIERGFKLRFDAKACALNHYSILPHRPGFGFLFIHLEPQILRVWSFSLCLGRTVDTQ